MKDKLKGIDSDDLIFELDRRRDMPDPEIEEVEVEIEVEIEVEKKITDLYRHLCDICEAGFHTSIQEILNKLEEKL